MKIAGERTSWFAVLAVCAAMVVAYWPALRGEFLWDDDGHVTAPELRSWAGLGRIWSEPGATQQYYPLLHTAFWVEQRLWGGAVLGYHLANLVQHLLAAGLLALVLRRLAVPGAGLAAAIFAVHPVHVESVAWISEQKNTLSLVFYLGAALAYLQFDDTRRRRYYWIGFGLFALGLLTKSVAATLPCALLVLLWWKRGRLAARTDVWPLVPWIIVGVIAGLFTAAVEHYLIGAGGADYAMTWVERGLLAGRVVWFYLGKLVWPAELTFIYPRWTIRPGEFYQWVPLVAAVALTVGLWRYRDRARAPLAALLLFGGTLFPVLGFLDIYPFRYSFVADHFQYLASIGPIALLAAALVTWSGVNAGRVRRLLGVSVVAVLALLTARQTPAYRSAEALYRHTLARNLECWMAHNNLGLIVAGRGDRAAAVAHFRQAVRLKPDYFDGHNNLGLTLTQEGRPAEAVPHLREAVRLDPTKAQAQNNLGIALAAVGRAPEAVQVFRSALRFMPDSPSLHDNLGKALRLAGRIEEASRAAETAARLRAAQRRE